MTHLTEARSAWKILRWQLPVRTESLSEISSAMAVHTRCYWNRCLPMAQAVRQQPDNTGLNVAYAIALVVDDQREVALTLAPEIIANAADILSTSQESALREHARALYEHVIDSAPPNAAAYFGLATLAYMNSDMPAAIDGYRRALELEPSNIDALNNLAWTLLQARSADANALEEALR